MAIVTSFEPSGKERQSVHRPTRCLYAIIDGDGGTRYLLDTVGSDERQFADKVSQSIQFDRQAAAQLIGLLRQTFPGLT